MQGFCQKLPNKHQGSQFNGAVFSTTLPLHCWAELAEHPIFQNLIKSFDVYIYRGIAHALGKARPHGRPGRRGAGRRSGLRPYPPLGAARSFSIVAPRPRANSIGNPPPTLSIHPPWLPSPSKTFFWIVNSYFSRVPTWCILNVGTVPTWCILNIGTVALFKHSFILFYEWHVFLIWISFLRELYSLAIWEDKPVVCV